MNQNLNTEESVKAGASDAPDHVWGAEAIGTEINRTAAQVYYLFAIGALDGAVLKLGHKTFVASRRALRKLHLPK
jgi:hypothetical protein